MASFLSSFITFLRIGSLAQWRRYAAHSRGFAGKHKAQPARSDEMKAEKQMKLGADQASQSSGTVLFTFDASRNTTMSSTGDKVKGMANEAVGNVKQGVGKATDNDRLRAEGAIQEKKGEAQQAVGKAKDAVKKGVDKA
jgi:uncharacterized protein YjbJ (UPF0337 family)